MKILICDYVGNSKQWLDQFTIKKNYEVVGTITPDSNQKSLLSEKSWDYLLIFEQNSRDFFKTLLQFFNIAEERTIYAMDYKSWAAHPSAVFEIVNPNSGGG